MAQVVKTAICLPKDAFDRIEALRKRSHVSRSHLIVEALHAWWRLQEQTTLEERYIAGYQREPEVAADVESFYQAGLLSHHAERW